MLFNSLPFLFFFPAVVFLYFLLPHKYRWILLLAASYYFYMCWKAEYIILILLSTIIDYYCALRMDRHEEKKDRKKYLYLSLITNLGILFAFKYFNFFSDSLKVAFDQFNIFYDSPVFNFLLPVGISFYTFQTLSYSIDVYKGRRKAEKHFGLFALYVSFFPQLVAGPIERSERLLPQFLEKHEFEFDRVKDGLKLMLWGFFKKLVIADHMGVYVAKVFHAPEEFGTVNLILALYCFAFQVYCDFSGYSDIAIGSAKVMGYDLMENFKQPYFSKSIRELWQRWHISLMTWFRDYIFNPLGSLKAKKAKFIRNTMIVFFISGLWHGAAWTYVLWGIFHGVMVSIDILTRKTRPKIYKFLGVDKFPRLLTAVKIIITFNIFSVALAFFRANSIGDSFIILRKIFLEFDPNIVTINQDAFNYIFAAVTVLFLMTVEYYQQNHCIIQGVSKVPRVLRWSIYYSIIIVCLFAIQKDPQEFVYFQF